MRARRRSRRVVNNPSQEGGRAGLENAKLLAEVRRLELELERYREHARRTSKLFLSVTNYAEWVRESARRDAEVALRKARARIRKHERATQELERTEDELARRKHELARLKAFTDATRERLSALVAEVQNLDGELAAGHDNSMSPALDDLQDTTSSPTAS